MYPIISILGREVGTYSLCTVVGLLVAGFVAFKLGKTKGFTVEDIIFVVLSIVAGILIDVAMNGDSLTVYINDKMTSVLIEGIAEEGGKTWLI